MVGAAHVTAEALVERAYELIARLDGDLHAVIGLRDADEARLEARSLDERAHRGERIGPLAGIPFLAKDSHDVAGLRTTQGSLLLADSQPAARDCPHIARLRAAGAIPIGKTNVPEFCFEGYTANRLFGATRNPWAHEWSPGGSSGGSAAAMAAGMVPFATAADGGGSIRIPASFCGLFGLKPTRGIVGRDPMPEWLDFATDGPLATSMADLRLLLVTEAGLASGDPASVTTAMAKRLVKSRGEVPDRPSLVLATPRFVDWGPLPSAVAGLFDAALESLESDLGLVVEPVATEQVLGGRNVQQDWLIAVSSESAHAIGRAVIEAEAERMDSAFLAALRMGLGVTIEDYLAARRRRTHHVRALDDLLGRDRVIVTPTLPVEGILADGREIGAEEPGTSFSSFNTQVANLTGHPALTVPAGLLPNGIPFGLQIVGPRFADMLVMDLGELWERAHPDPRVAPGYEPFWPVG